MALNRTVVRQRLPHGDVQGLSSGIDRHRIHFSSFATDQFNVSLSISRLSSVVAALETDLHLPAYQQLHEAFRT